MQGWQPWLSLTWNLPVLILSALLLGGYAVAVHRVRASGLDWPWRRVAAWAAGVAAVLAVTVDGVGRYAGVLLWVFTLQVLVLLLLAPVLLCYGRPLALAADALSARQGIRLLRVAGSWPVRVLTAPLLGPLLVPAVLAAVYFTPLLDLALERRSVAEVLQVLLVAVGLVIAVGLVGDGTERESALALGASVAIGLVEFLTDAVPGMVIRLSTHPIAGAGWSGLHRPWGPTPLHDQQRAGALLWFVAEAADLPFLVILLRRWIRADERDAAAIDHALDLRYATPASPEPADDAQLSRPWWETDPGRLGTHRLAREYPAVPPDRSDPA